MAFPIGAAIAGLGSVIGGLFSSKGSSSAAQAQLQAARETNQMNYQIAQENNAFNEKMWNKQNEYNTPAAQRARLEQAGLNPYLMLDGSSTGNASSSVTADTSGTQVAPDVGSTIASGYQALGNTVSSAASQIAQMVYNNQLQQANVNKTNAEARSSALDAQYKELQNSFATANFLADLKTKENQNKISEQEYEFLKNSMEDRLQSAHFDWQLKGEQSGYYNQLAGITAIQAKIQDENLKWLPKEKSANLAATLQNTLTAASQMHLNEKQARLMVANTALTWANEHGVKLDNYVKDSVSDLSIGLVENQYGKGYAESEQYRRGLNLPLQSQLAASLASKAYPNKQKKRHARTISRP